MSKKYAFIAILLLPACSNEQLDAIDLARAKSGLQLTVCQLYERVQLTDQQRKSYYGSVADGMLEADQRSLEGYLKDDFVFGSASFRAVKPESLAHCVDTLAVLLDELNAALQAEANDEGFRSPLARSRAQEVFSAVDEHLTESEAWNAKVRRRNQRR